MSTILPWAAQYPRNFTLHSLFFSLTYNIFKLFITSEPCSILPSSHFSSHHPLLHLQCHLCQLWLAFFGFSKKISPGIVLHSLFDRKDVPELTHKAGVFLEIGYSASSDGDNWHQLGECSFIHWPSEQKNPMQFNIFMISSPFTLSLVATIDVFFQSDRYFSEAVTYSQVLQVFTKLLWISIEVWSSCTQQVDSKFFHGKFLWQVIEEGDYQRTQSPSILKTLKKVSFL